MKYFEQAPKDKLREYQRKAIAARNERTAVRDAKALQIFNKDGIHAVMEYFDRSRDAAYKMVQRAKKGK